VLGALCLAGAVALSSGGGSARASDKAAPAVIKAVFNLDGTISVTLSDGSPVGTVNPPGTMIPPGVYNIHIDDTAAVLHLFHLVGPGVYVSTNPLTAGPDGESVFNEFYEVTFLPNSTYVYQDDYAVGATRRVFSTSGGGAGTGGASTSSASSSGQVITGGSISGSKGTPSSAPLRFRGALAATVGATGSLGLSFRGKAVEKLNAGRYTITVADRSASYGFVLKQLKRKAMTVADSSFVGKRSLRVDLTAGQWFFSPTPRGKKTYFIVTK
jgi:hypothetical protein